jgi:hypothetical protein
MISKTDRTSGPTGGASTTATRGSERELLRLLEAFPTEKLPPGTADAVANLSAQLRSSGPALQIEAELRHGDEFHEAFHHLIEDLALDARREGVTISIDYTTGAVAATMTIAVSGPAKTVEDLEQQIRDTARQQAVELR